MKETFIGFQYAAKELSAFIYGAGIFVISLKNGEVINHEPADVEAFQQWLNHHNIRDVKKELPQHIYDVLIKKDK